MDPPIRFITLEIRYKSRDIGREGTARVLDFFYVTAMDLENAKENHRAKKSPQIMATLTGRFSFFMESYKQISVLFKFSNELWSNSLL